MFFDHKKWVSLGGDTETNYKTVSL